MAYDKYGRLKYFGAMVEAGTATSSQREQFEDSVTGVILDAISNGRTNCYDRFVEANGYRLVTNYDPHDDVVADLPAGYVIITPDKRAVTMTVALREIVRTRWPELMQRVDISGIEAALATVKAEA